MDRKSGFTANFLCRKESQDEEVRAADEFLGGFAVGDGTGMKESCFTGQIRKKLLTFALSTFGAAICVVVIHAVHSGSNWEIHADGTLIIGR